MHVTVLAVEHALAYRTLLLQAYEQEADAFTSTREERAALPESWWLKRMADPDGYSLAFGAFDGDELIGTVTLELSSKVKTRHKAHVVGMFVAKTYRGS